MKKKVLTKGTFERQMAELRKKIKTTIQVEASDIILSLTDWWMDWLIDWLSDIWIDWLVHLL